MSEWRIKNGILAAAPGRPLIMGILNITPDSFSDGGRCGDAQTAYMVAQRLSADGADIIDVGGQSTRPGHTPVTAQEEWDRLAPFMELLRSRGGLPPVSVDTYYPQVAGLALDSGVSIINDIHGFCDPEMRELAARTGCGCVVMHGEDITGCEDPVAEVRSFFERRVGECVSAGIRPEQIVLDPGIGFGKTREQELELLHRCGECRVKGLPVLIGASRKRLIAWMMNEPDSVPSDRDWMTHRAHAIAAASGAEIVRVHDAAGAAASFLPDDTTI